MYNNDTTPYNNDSYTATEDKNDKITCLHCGKKYHQLAVHLSSKHGTNVSEYTAAFPTAPTVSAYSSRQISVAQSGTTKTHLHVPTYVSSVVAATIPHLSSVSSEENDAPIQYIVRTPVDTLTFGPVSLAVFGGLTEDNQRAVPAHDPNYQVDINTLTYIAAGISMFENILITGPTGSGKTTAVTTLAAILNRPITRINLNGDTRAADLVGDYSVVIDEDTGKAITSFQEGPVCKAMRQGHILLLDEVDAANPSVHFVLQKLTERHHNPAQAVANGQAHTTIDLPTGDIVHAHPDFRIVSTANTVGTGDLTGDYAATNILNGAFLDRFGIKLMVGYPDESKWKTIIKAKTPNINAQTVKHIVETAIKVNEGKSQGLCRQGISPRKTLTWARLATAFGTKQAAQLTILNGIDALDPDVQFVNDIITAVTGEV